MLFRSCVRDSGPSASWYYATAMSRAVRPALTDSHEVDVCVVGAGITGCSTALHLAQKGYSVAVLEAEFVGYGASGRSGGQAIAGYNVSQSDITRLVGSEDARQLWDLSEEAMRCTRSLVQEHAIACDWTDGHILAGEKPRHAREIRTILQEWKSLGRVDLEYWESYQIRQALDSPRYTCALHDPHGGHLHPLNYTLGLAGAAERAGALFYDKTPVVSWHGNGPIVISTPQGQLRARFLILCGNAYFQSDKQRISRTIMPVGTYIAATEPLGESRARALIPNNQAVADMRFVLNYFRRSRDHRLLYGGRVSYSRLNPLRVAEAMRRSMVDCFPQLSDVAVEYVWGGDVAITINRLPHFGRLSSNVFFAHGFSGHGIALTGFAGRLMAEAVDGHAARFDVFSRIPHRSFPGGTVFRTPLLVLAMAWRQLRDLL